VNLIFTKVNATAGKVSWSAPSESNGKLRSYRIYYTPEENADKPLDEWAQVSSNQTLVEITGFLLASYSITVKASTQVRNQKSVVSMEINKKIVLSGWVRKGGRIPAGCSARRGQGGSRPH